MALKVRHLIVFYAFLFFYAIASFSKTVLLKSHNYIEQCEETKEFEKKNVLISSARLYVHKNVKIAYICIMYIPVWPHNGVKSFLEEHSYFSASVFFIPFDVLTVSAESAQMYVLHPIQ